MDNGVRRAKWMQTQMICCSGSGCFMLFFCGLPSNRTSSLSVCSRRISISCDMRNVWSTRTTDCRCGILVNSNVANHLVVGHWNESEDVARTIIAAEWDVWRSTPSRRSYNVQPIFRIVLNKHFNYTLVLESVGQDDCHTMSFSLRWCSNGDCCAAGWKVGGWVAVDWRWSTSSSRLNSITIQITVCDAVLLVSCGERTFRRYTWKKSGSVWSMHAAESEVKVQKRL